MSSKADRLANILSSYDFMDEKLTRMMNMPPYDLFPELNIPFREPINEDDLAMVRQRLGEQIKGIIITYIQKIWGSSNEKLEINNYKVKINTLKNTETSVRDELYKLFDMLNHLLPTEKQFAVGDKSAKRSVLELVMNLEPRVDWLKDEIEMWRKNEKDVTWLLNVLKRYEREHNETIYKINQSADDETRTKLDKTLAEYKQFRSEIGNILNLKISECVTNNRNISRIIGDLSKLLDKEVEDSAYFQRLNRVLPSINAIMMTTSDASTAATSQIDARNSMYNEQVRDLVDKIVRITLLLSSNRKREATDEEGLKERRCKQRRDIRDENNENTNMTESSIHETANTANGPILENVETAASTEPKNVEMTTSQVLESRDDSNINKRARKKLVDQKEKSILFGILSDERYGPKLPKMPRVQTIVQPTDASSPTAAACSDLPMRRQSIVDGSPLTTTAMTTMHNEQSDNAIIGATTTTAIPSTINISDDVSRPLLQDEQQQQQQQQLSSPTMELQSQIWNDGPTFDELTFAMESNDDKHLNAAIPTTTTTTTTSSTLNTPVGTPLHETFEASNAMQNSDSDTTSLQNIGGDVIATSPSLDEMLNRDSLKWSLVDVADRDYIYHQSVDDQQALNISAEEAIDSFRLDMLTTQDVAPAQSTTSVMPTTTPSPQQQLLNATNPMDNVRRELTNTAEMIRNLNEIPTSLAPTTSTQSSLRGAIPKQYAYATGEDKNRRKSNRRSHKQKFDSRRYAEAAYSDYQKVPVDDDL